MFQGFPYSDMHQLNLDWIIKIAKDFLDQYTHIQDLIDQGLTDLQDKYNNLEALLDEWYNTHSEDIANQLADALNDLNAWYTEHEDYLDQTLADNISAFDTHAEQKAEQTLESIPDDYTALGNAVTNITHAMESENIAFLSNANTGYYINASGELVENQYLQVSDYIKVPDNAVSFTEYVFRNGTAFNPIACGFDENKNFVMAFGSANHVNGYKTLSIPGNVKYIRFNQSAETDDQANILFMFNIMNYKNSEFVGFDSFSASNETSSARWSNLGNTKLTAGNIYLIVPRTAFAQDRYRFFMYDTANNQLASTNYVDLNKYNGMIAIRPTVTGVLRLYNVEQASSVSIDIAIFRYGFAELETVKNTYYVTKSTSFKNAPTFNSLTECLLFLKDDEREKTIYVEGGDYDIVQEYQDANVPVYTGDNPTSDYFNYCVWVPKNTHIIGRGLVRLLWMPDAGDITLNQSKTVSPLNVAANCTIENIEVHCKNGRYCLHNDGLNKFEFIGARQIYRNVKFVKYVNDTDPDTNQTYGFTQTTGFGISAMMVHEYDNCQFINENQSNAFYGHNRNVVVVSQGTLEITEENSGTIILKNCVFDTPYTHAVRLDNVSSTELHTRVMVSNCYLTGDILVNKATDYPNQFEVLVMNSGSVTVAGITSSDRFPAKIYS